MWAATGRPLGRPLGGHWAATGRPLQGQLFRVGRRRRLGCAGHAPPHPMRVCYSRVAPAATWGRPLLADLVRYRVGSTELAHIRNAGRAITSHSQDTVKIQSRYSQDTVKIQSRCGQEMGFRLRFLYKKLYLDDGMLPIKLYKYCLRPTTFPKLGFRREALSGMQLSASILTVS